MLLGRRIPVAQYHEVNGYKSHAEWLDDWRDARSNEFFVLGSRDETAGCQLCVATVADDGSLTLRLDARLSGTGVRQVSCNRERTLRLWARAGPGGASIQCGLQGLSSSTGREGSTCHRSRTGDKLPIQARRSWLASVRHHEDGEGVVVTDRSLGAIGIDLNADHLAVAEADRSGNFINTFSVPLVTYGKSAHQKLL